MTAPKVSIITVNFNMAAALGSTLESVLAQDYADFELIVIDGGSTDNSQEVIASYAPRIAHWVSGPDRSLYDAMNKGVAVAKGEWVLFMNSGDQFAAPNVLSRVFMANHDDADLLYGHHVRRYPALGIERLIPAEAPDTLPLRMHCSHQSLFTRREILHARPFEIALLAADYDAILAAYVSGKRFQLVDCIIARTEVGGRSDTQRLKSLRQRVGILQRHGLMTRRLMLHYRLLMARAIAVDTVKTVLPKSLQRVILRHRPIKGLG